MAARDAKTGYMIELPWVSGSVSISLPTEAWLKKPRKDYEDDKDQLGNERDLADQERDTPAVRDHERFEMIADDRHPSQKPRKWFANPLLIHFQQGGELLRVHPEERRYHRHPDEDTGGGQQSPQDSSSNQAHVGLLPLV